MYGCFKQRDQRLSSPVSNFLQLDALLPLSLLWHDAKMPTAAATPASRVASCTFYSKSRNHLLACTSQLFTFVNVQRTSKFP